MPTPQPGAEDDDLAAYKTLARDLADLQMQVARTLRDRIVPTQDAAPPAHDAHLPALAVAFDRVAAGIRRTILLGQRLAEPPRDRPAPNPDKRQARKRVLRAVEDAIGHAPLEPDHAERLTAELHERLETLDFEDDLDHRPADEIITEILHDLGLGALWGTSARWQRRTPEQVAALAARAADTLLRHPGLPDPVPNPERHFRLLATPNP